MQITINITKKHLTILTILIALSAGIFVFAYNTGQPTYVGHTADEIVVKIDGQQMTLQQAIEEGKIGGSSTRNINDEDLIWFGNLGRFLREGATTGIPSVKYATGTTCYMCAYAQAKKENGKIYTRAWTGPCGGVKDCAAYGYGICDSGWIEGYTAECTKVDGSVRGKSKAVTTYGGVKLYVPTYFTGSHPLSNFSEWKE